jgi:hypothetical protein
MRKGLRILIVVLLGALCSVAVAAEGDKFSKQQLDQLLAPIALYPDDLLTNVLMASTYPLDVVQAARWRKESGNAKLKGDALTKALEGKDWDPSVKALVQFPDVLNMMSDQLEWTQKLGDAFLAQQDDVMDEIQLLRGKAADAGNLESNEYQRVEKEAAAGGEPIYVIEPTAEQTVYVPVYEPSVVYGPWWYPDYPPYYWPYPGARFVNGYFWGAGVAIAAGIWGWNHFDWHDHDIDINVNKWNNINGKRADITNNKWQHRPDHRGPVPYRDKATREKYGQAARAKAGDKEFRGHDRDKVDRAQVEARLKETDHAGVKDRAKDAGPRRDGDRKKPEARDKPAPRKADRAPDRKAKPAAKRPSPAAFDVKRGSDVKKYASRGHASRSAVQHRGGGGPRGGGGRGRGGGGGRRR